MDAREAGLLGVGQLDLYQQAGSGLPGVAIGVASELIFFVLTLFWARFPAG
jgi:hypothetical protein